MSNEELAVYLKENPEDKARQEVLYFQVVNYVKKYINRFSLLLTKKTYYKKAILL